MTLTERRRVALRRKTQLRPRCVTGRKRYKTRDDAQAALDLIAAVSNQSTRRAVEVRECARCGGFHVSATPKPLPPQSKKRVKEQRQRTKMLRETFGDNPACVRCGRPADDAHEIVSRARLGSITDPANIAPLCRPCHSFVTTHPVEAAAEGLALRKEAVS